MVVTKTSAALGAFCRTVKKMYSPIFCQNQPRRVHPQSIPSHAVTRVCRHELRVCLHLGPFKVFVAVTVFLKRSFSALSSCPRCSAGNSFFALMPETGAFSVVLPNPLPPLQFPLWWARLRLPIGRFDTKFPGVVCVQSLPAVKSHGIRPDDAPDGRSAEKVIQNIETNMPSGSTHRDEVALDIVP